TCRAPPSAWRLPPRPTSRGTIWSWTAATRCGERGTSDGIPGNGRAPAGVSHPGLYDLSRDRPDRTAHGAAPRGGPRPRDRPGDARAAGPAPAADPGVRP